MSGLRFIKRQDGVKRARVRIEYAADVSHLETSIIYAYQNDEPPVAVATIRRLSKMDIIKLTKELFRQRGYAQEFIGEDCDQAIHVAAKEQVEKHWPELT